MKCFIKTCNRDADYLIESNTPSILVGIIKYFLHRNKHPIKYPICKECLRYICWDFDLYNLNGEFIKYEFLVEKR